MADAQEQRSKEKATNLDTIADAQAGSQAVKKALEILREFYSSVAFVQQSTNQVPEMAEYRGLQGKNKGVIGMLEVILTDFSRLEVDTKSAEAQAAREHAEFMSDSRASKLAKHNA